MTGLGVLGQSLVTVSVDEIPPHGIGFPRSSKHPVGVGQLTGPGVFGHSLVTVVMDGGAVIVVTPPPHGIGLP